MVNQLTLIFFGHSLSFPKKGVNLKPDYCGFAANNLTLVFLLPKLFFS